MSATNQIIGDRLREAADLLEQQRANPFRVRAYRDAAATVAHLATGLGEIHERDGLEGLEALPGIGPRIAAAIAEMLRTGRWSQLDRLRGASDPERLFRAIPGVGPALAPRSPACSVAPGFGPGSRWKSRRSRCSSTWTGNIDRRRRPVGCPGSPPVASIPPPRPGCPCSTPSAIAGT